MTYVDNTFPTSIQNPTSPTANDAVADFDHAGLEDFQNQSIKALKDKVGADGSAVQTSHDYKLSGVIGSDKAASRNGTETFTNKTLINPTLSGAVVNAPLTRPRITTSIDDANGNEVIQIPATASAVNEVTITNSATGNDVQITTTGNDTNIGLKIKAKGTGKVKIGTAELQMPNADGTAGQVMQTDGAGNLLFATSTNVISGAILMWGTASAPTGYLLCDGTAVSRATYSTLFGILSTTYGAGDGSTTFNLPDLRSRVAVGAGTGTKVATFASRSGNVITVTGLSNVANNEFQTGASVRYSTSGSVITGLTNNTDYFVIRTGNLTFSLATTLANAIAGTAIALSSNGTGTQTFTETFTARTVGDTGGEENHGLTVTEMPAHTHDTVIGAGGSGGASYSSGAQPAGSNTFTSTATGGSNIHNNMQPFTVLNYIIKT